MTTSIDSGLSFSETPVSEKQALPFGLFEMPFEDSKPQPEVSRYDTIQ